MSRSSRIHSALRLSPSKWCPALDVLYKTNGESFAHCEKAASSKLKLWTLVMTGSFSSPRARYWRSPGSRNAQRKRTAGIPYWNFCHRKSCWILSDCGKKEDRDLMHRIRLRAFRRYSRSSKVRHTSRPRRSFHRRLIWLDWQGSQETTAKSDRSTFHEFSTILSTRKSVSKAHATTSLTKTFES